MSYQRGDTLKIKCPECGDKHTFTIKEHDYISQAYWAETDECEKKKLVGQKFHTH